MCYEIWLDFSVDLNHSYNSWKTSTALEIYILEI